MAKKKLSGLDYVVVGPTAVKKKPTRDVRKEILNKGNEVDYQTAKIIDFERSLGYKGNSEQAKIVNKKIKVFDPKIEKENKLLTELLNSEQHQILTWDRSWTPDGRYVVCVVYGELETKANEAETE